MNVDGYIRKFNVDGSLHEYKARLVSKGYTQQTSLDFIDTFSPVTTITFVIIILSLVAAQKWKLAQLDINNTFLNGALIKEIYIDLPLGYPREG